MAYTTPRTWVVGETVTAAQFNQQIRDNLNALWVGTTAGDMAYFTSNTARARLGIGAAGSLLRSTGSAPAWLAPGTEGKVLTISAGVPAWVAPAYVPYTDRCSVYNATNLNSVPNGAITWANEHYDTSGWHSTSVNTQRITVNAAGTYIATAYILHTGQSTLLTYRAAILVNNLTVVSGETTQLENSRQPEFSLTTRPIDLVNGNYFSVYLDLSGISVNVDATSYFSVVRIA
jgi:hypothetical protein